MSAVRGIGGKQLSQHYQKQEKPVEEFNLNEKNSREKRPLKALAPPKGDSVQISAAAIAASKKMNDQASDANSSE